MEEIEKNTVSVKNQTKQLIILENRNGKGKRVLFVGNSITVHLLFLMQGKKIIFCYRLGTIYKINKTTAIYCKGYMS